MDRFAAASKAKTETPALPSPLAIKVSDEEGYRIEEGFLRVKINNRLVLLQGLVVKKADAVGKLPIMIITHGTNSSASARQEMTPRGTKDGDLRLLRAYAQRGWLVVYALRRGYGQSDGPIPIAATKCDGSSPTVQEFFDADADDLEAVLAHIGQRDDADPDRIMAFGVSGGGGAVVALGARNIPGVKVIINVSGGLRNTGCSNAQNYERLIAAARHYGTKSKVPNLWYYAETDEYVPGPTAAATEIVVVGDLLFRHGEPTDPALLRRYQLYKRVKAALELPMGPECIAALQAAKIARKH